jgi:hypothetical protein
MSHLWCTRRPGPVILAIAHAEGRNRVLDAVRDGISVEDSYAVLRRYDISNVTAALDDGESDGLAHAVAGALVLAA